MTDRNTPSDQSGAAGRAPGPPLDSRILQILKIILFAIIYQVCEVVWAFVSVFQAGALLLTGAPSPAIAEFAGDLTDYMALVLRFVCQRTSEPPWPLGDAKRG